MSAPDVERARKVLRQVESSAVADARIAARDPRAFTVTEWLARDLPPLDHLLGELFSTTSRVLLIGPTGAGKSNFGLALGWSMAECIDFLHWRAHRPARRLLYIDGEMSARVARDRLKEAAKRHGSIPDNLILINRDDYPDMPPLNTQAGQQYIDSLIERAGGVEFIIFDNVQSLLVGDMKEEDSWAATLPWIRNLTSRGIGQLWQHHTGHDATRGYGSKTREWQLDTVALMIDREDKGDLLIDFDLKFTKARERKLTNRTDFADARIWINTDGQWESSVMTTGQRTRKPRPLPPETLKALDYLRDVLAERGETPGRSTMPNVKAVKMEHWREYLKRRGLHEGGDSGKKWFQRVRERLIAAELIAVDEPYVWIVTKPGQST